MQWVGYINIINFYADVNSRSIVRPHNVSSFFIAEKV